MKMMRRTVQAVLTVAAALVLMLAFGTPAQASSVDLREEVEAYADLYRVDEDEVIAEGVSIGGIDLGGLTLMEAVDAVLSGQQAMLNTEVTLQLEDRAVTYTMEQLGLSFVNPSEEIVKAACLGKTGSLIERYKANADIAHGGYEMPTVQYTDEYTAEKLVKQFAETVNVPAVDATITKDSTDTHTFTVTHESSGIAVDQEDLLDQVLQAIEGWDGAIAITLTAKSTVLEPKYTYAELSTIKHCLGSFATICGDINSARGQNVMAGAAKMDGNIILPGESYSVVDVLVPFTEENGYTYGTQYKDGAYDSAIGGGVCSLSSTLYNALLYAELQIDKRWNHSMTVSYVPMGFDSTVNDDGSRDLVFTNDTDYPIYIEAYTVDTVFIDDWLYFNIYGVDTRDHTGRELKFTNNVLEYDMPTEDEFTYKEDYTLAPGEKVWEQGNYPHAVVEAYKEVWINGELVSKELLHTDTYRRSPAIIRYNPTPAPTEEPTTEEPTTELPETDVPTDDTDASGDNSDAAETLPADSGSEE